MTRAWRLNFTSHCSRTPNNSPRTHYKFGRNLPDFGQTATSEFGHLGPAAVEASTKFGHLDHQGVPQEPVKYTSVAQLIDALPSNYNPISSLWAPGFV